MKCHAVLLSAGVLLLGSACIQVNVPETRSAATSHYALELPKDFKTPNVRVAVAEFSSESPAKFKMLSRTGTTLMRDPLAKWTQSPSVLLSSAFRDLFGCDETDYSKAKYLLEGDIYVFERNLDTKTADLKVLYRLVRTDNNEGVFAKPLVSSVPVKDDSNKAFADAMSKAVVEQAEKIRQEINALADKKK